MDRPGIYPALTVWHIAFVDYGRNLWWHRWCRPGFRHVFAFAYDASLDTWIVFDPTLEGFVVRQVPRSGVDAMISEIWRRNGTILRCRVEGRGVRRPRLFSTCVTVMLHLLGVRGCAVRPYGLYRLLLRRGGVRVMERADEGIVRRTEGASSRHGA